MARTAHQVKRSWLAAMACLIALGPFTPHPLAAQSAPAAKQATPPKSSAAKVSAAKDSPKAAPLQVAPEQILYLIRSTLLTLNDANRSGNYAVLRDLASPDFQANNSAADLAIAFTDLRSRKFDLFGVALLAPQLGAAPTIDTDGRLRLSGVFPTRPLQISFDLMFVVHAEQWKLLGIAVATPEAPPLAAQNPTTTAPPPSSAPSWLSSVTR